MARLSTHKLLVSVDAIVVLEHLAMAMAHMLPNLVLGRGWQRHESLVTVLLGNMALSPTLIPSSNNMNPTQDPPSTLALRHRAGSRVGRQVAGHLVPWEALFSPKGISKSLAGV